MAADRRKTVEALGERHVRDSRADRSRRGHEESRSREADDDRLLAPALAKKHGTTIACPITTGIFAWIAAHAADEGEAAGAKRITPYWRTLKTGGELNPKYPGGIKNLRARLTAEGHKVVAKGKRYFVADFERAVVEPML